MCSNSPIPGKGSVDRHWDKSGSMMNFEERTMLAGGLGGQQPPANPEGPTSSQNFR